MDAVGLIVEYNPFHNGHKLHLDRAKKLSGAEVAIAVMSGDFLQRGEPALLNKWKRAEMALKNGVDIVVEMPVYFSNQSAEIFAEGGIRILDALGVATVVFGSETADLERLEKIASIEEDESFQNILKEHLAEGISFPNALDRTISEFIGEQGALNPNDILGVEYIKSIKKIGSNIVPLAIKREAVGYHSKNIVGEIASATSIRHLLSEGRVNEVMGVVPKMSYEVIKKEYDSGSVTFLEDYYHLLRYEILRSKEELPDIQDMEVGLENRLYRCALDNDDFSGFYSDLMTKRYTNARMQRVLTHIILGITDKFTKKAREKLYYIRVLGFTKKGSKYLKKIKNELSEKGLDLFTNLKNVEKRLGIDEKEMLDFDLRASKIYGIVKPYTERKIPILLEGE